MRESRTYGSVRGALSNERPYRDPFPKRPLSLSLDGDGPVKTWIWSFGVNGDTSRRRTPPP